MCVSVKSFLTCAEHIRNDVKEYDERYHHGWVAIAQFSLLPFINYFRYLECDSLRRLRVTQAENKVNQKLYKICFQTIFRLEAK